MWWYLLFLTFDPISLQDVVQCNAMFVRIIFDCCFEVHVITYVMDGHT